MSDTTFYGAYDRAIIHRANARIKLIEWVSIHGIQSKDIADLYMECMLEINEILHNTVSQSSLPHDYLPRRKHWQSPRFTPRRKR